MVSQHQSRGLRHRHSQRRCRVFLVPLIRAQSLGVELVAEDHLTENGGTAGNARVHAYSSEERAMSLAEAEQLALLLIDAVKIARDTQNKPANRF